MSFWFQHTMNRRNKGIRSVPKWVQEERERNKPIPEVTYWYGDERDNPPKQRTQWELFKEWVWSFFVIE